MIKNELEEGGAGVSSRGNIMDKAPEVVLGAERRPVWLKGKGNAGGVAMKCVQPPDYRPCRLC